MASNKGVLPIFLQPTDYVAGGETGIVPKEINQSSDWSLDLPLDEEQEILIGGLKYETGGCVTFSALNLLETQGNFMIRNGLIKPENIQKLQDWGFIVNGKLNFSDRFIYKLSGTTQAGNTFVKVWDTIRRYGLVPESMWQTSGLKSFEEFTIGIPKEVVDFGQNILTIFNFNYEWVITGQCGAPDLSLIKTHLKQAPLQVAHAYCGADSNGTTNICQGCNAQHATMIYKVDNFVKDFDSILPFRKNFVLSYPLIWALKGVITEKQPIIVPQPQPFGHQFNFDMQYRQTSEEVRWLQKALIRMGYNTFATGKYLDLTKAAVGKFQKDYGVYNPLIVWYDQSEYVGPKTRSALNRLLNK